MWALLWAIVVSCVSVVASFGVFIGLAWAMNIDFIGYVYLFVYIVGGIVLKRMIS